MVPGGQAIQLQMVLAFRVVTALTVNDDGKLCIGTWNGISILPYSKATLESVAAHPLTDTY